MPRVLLVWEIGADYGHLMRLASLARELARRGHRPVLALRDLTHVETVLGDAPSFAVVQAPVFNAEVTGLPEPASFAETLLRIGFMHPMALAGVCRAWRTLVDAVRPALVVFDYAPTALLATRGLRVPRMLFGDTFAQPPATAPMPGYRWWQPESPARLAASEAVALEGANAVLARRGEPPMSRLADLFDVDASVLSSCAALDHYPGRTGAAYDGALPTVDQGVAPDWPLAGSHRVFAYIKPRWRDFERLLAALRELDVAALVHAPGVSQAVQRRQLSANLRFSEAPVRIADVRSECDVGICHASGMTTQALLAAGKPLLLLPDHIEQTMTARRVAASGAGIAVDRDRPPPDYRRLLKRLLDEPAFALAARAMATTLAAPDPAAGFARVADRCESLIASAPRR